MKGEGGETYLSQSRIPPEETSIFTGWKSWRVTYINNFPELVT